MADIDQMAATIAAGLLTNEHWNLGDQDKTRIANYSVVLAFKIVERREAIEAKRNPDQDAARDTQTWVDPVGNIVTPTLGMTNHKMTQLGYKPYSG